IWTSSDWPAIVEDLEGTNRKDPATGGWISQSVPYPVFEALRNRSTSFSNVVAFGANINVFNVQFEGKPYSASGEPVSGEYFHGLGVQTIIGRPILPDDDSANAPGVAVVSHKFWKARLGGDESAVGKAIVIDNVPLELIGVAPPEFFGTQPGENIDVWITLHTFPKLIEALNYTGPLPFRADASPFEFWEKPSTWWLVVMGRMKPGATEAEARVESETIFN